jgi:NAD(P)H-hydrate epimerase
MNILNAGQMRAADAHAIHDLGIPSMTLMENAASEVVKVIVERYPEKCRVLVVCGKGNNGGDGLAVVRLLKLRGWDASAVLLGKSSELKADPASNFARAIAMQVLVKESTDAALLQMRLVDSDLVVDAVFGTGLARAAEGAYAQAIEAINASGKTVVAIDVPSGLSSDTGARIGPAVIAHTTVVLAALKYCHVLAPACSYCGDVYVRDIGIPTESSVTLIGSREVAALLPNRIADGHKGTFGHALVIAGSKGKAGAAYLCGKAALRAGAGLVTVASPSGAQPAVASYGPEIMTESVAGHPDFFSAEAFSGLMELARDKNVVAIGPGVGTHTETLALFRKLIGEVEAPIVIDADGLNLLATDRSILLKRKPATTILTPHPGEMARLLGTTTAQVQNDRIAAALSLSRDSGAIVVLKGYRTVIADPKGHVRVNPSGGPALASGGTGDVLTGAISGFVAQGVSLEDAAQAAVFAHGLTGNLWGKKFPQQAMNALDILSHWNEAIHLIRTDKNLDGDYFGIHLI